MIAHRIEAAIMEARISGRAPVGVLLRDDEFNALTVELRLSPLASRAALLGLPVMRWEGQGAPAAFSFLLCCAWDGSPSVETFT